MTSKHQILKKPHLIWLSSLYSVVKNEFSISCFEISFPLSKIFSFLTLDMSHSYRNDPQIFNNHRGEKGKQGQAFMDLRLTNSETCCCAVPFLSFFSHFTF